MTLEINDYFVSPEEELPWQYTNIQSYFITYVFFYHIVIVQFVR